MTEEMLEQCIRLKQEIDTAAAAAKDTSTRLDSLKKELGSLLDYLKKSKETITPPQLWSRYRI